jgi:hypothetical protein
MTAQLIYVDTIGCHVHITAPADLETSVSAVVITVRKPSGDVTEWTPASVTYDAESEVSTIEYETVAGDLDEAGLYALQPVVTMTDGDVWPLGVALWKILARFEVS